VQIQFAQALEPILTTLAPGLTRNAQLEALFQTFEMSPDVFATRFRGLPPGEQERLHFALALAREYALYRERHSSAKRSQSQFPWTLLSDLDPAIRNEAREWFGFWVRFRQGHWSELQWVERGVRTHVNFEARELFARALPLRPRAMVIVHNHPSGDTEPSWVDLQLTRQVGELSQHLGIELLGHWIVGPHSETWLPLQKQPRNKPT